jgi:lipoprotein NlpI
MSSARLHLLLQFYNDDPNDPFNGYALALEYLKSDAARAKEFFDLVLAQHEEYVPVYYHAARFYADRAEKEKAMALYEKGISMAKKHNDLKAARELQSAYDELMYD